MRLPNMVKSDGIMKMRQIQFGGIDRREGAKDGAFERLVNFTSDSYPILATRQKRVKYWSIPIEDEFTSGRGLFAFNKLCWIIGRDFYWDGEKVEGIILSGPYDASMAAFGNYIVIMPWGYVFHTEKKTVERIACGVQGETLKFDSSANDIGNVLEMGNIIWANQGFHKGDCVYIEGCTIVPGNNKPAIIRDMQGTKLYFDDGTFAIPNEERSYTDEGTISVERRSIELDRIVECDNRIWGCKGDTIYASKLGDPFNFFAYDGLETDSWTSDTGTAGEFTGAINYGGRPYFFKEDKIVKIYGSTASGFGFNISSETGVMSGSGKSLAVVEGTLFYVSRKGVMAYAGGAPTCISDSLGDYVFTDCGAASTGSKYYMSGFVKEKTKQSPYTEPKMLVYDRNKGIWLEEDWISIVGVAYLEGETYILNADAEIWKIDVVDSFKMETEPEVKWEAITADFVEDVTNGWMRIGANKKAVSKLQVRLTLEKNAYAAFWIYYGSEGVWHHVGTVQSGGGKKSVVLPIIPQRADHYKIAINGVGGVKIYSLAREFYSGSER